MPINVRERDRIWQDEVGDTPVPAIPSPATGVNLPAPFPIGIIKTLPKGVYSPDGPTDPSLPPIIVDPPVDPEDPTPDPPPAFLDGYWEVFHQYPIGAAGATLSGGHNWMPGSSWAQSDTIEQTVVFADAFEDEVAGNNLEGHEADFGATGAWV